MSDRAKLFEDDDLDLTEFKPKEGPRPAGPDPEEVRAVSEAAQFSSREPKPVRPKTAVTRPAPEPAVTPKRLPRRHRTGRTMQFNARTTQETYDGFYAIADAQNWLVGETLEKALAALRRELAAQSGGSGQGRG